VQREKYRISVNNVEVYVLAINIAYNTSNSVTITHIVTCDNEKEIIYFHSATLGAIISEFVLALSNSAAICSFVSLTTPADK
jgi:hypothetical protein